VTLDVPTMQRWTRWLRMVNRVLVGFIVAAFAYDLYLFGSWLAK
jgi:Tfp pilus assembly protein PilO